MKKPAFIKSFVYMQQLASSSGTPSSQRPGCRSRSSRDAVEVIASNWAFFISDHLERGSDYEGEKKERERGKRKGVGRFERLALLNVTFASCISNVDGGDKKVTCVHGFEQPSRVAWIRRGLLGGAGTRCAQDLTETTLL